MLIRQHRPYPEAHELAVILLVCAAWWAWERAKAVVRVGDLPEL